MMSKAPANDHRVLRRARAFASHYRLVLQVPHAWLKSLFRARVLIDGRWSHYMGFRPKNALNNLFYRTQWLNIDRYGRNSVSPVAGLGQHPLSRWFHISAISHCLFAHAGAATMLGGTIVWVLLHLVWAQISEFWWVSAVTLTLMMSTTAYAMAFVRQNYNVLGWLWLPLALFAVATEQWIVAAFAFLAASLASITVVFVAVPLMLTQSIVSMNAAPLLVLIPGMTKVLLHGRSLFRNGDFKTSVLNMGKHIGVIPARLKYERVSTRFGRFNTYFSLLYVAACAASWTMHDAVPWLPAIAAIIFVVNQRFLRFADDQSVIILFTTVFAAHVLVVTPDIATLVLFFIVVNPLPNLLGLVAVSPDNESRQIAVYGPFDHTSIEKDCETLFENVAAGSRILFAFDDPEGKYENLFDGYRNAIEPFLYVAARRKIHLFPDWHAVTETNTEGDFYIWGRSVDDVGTNAKHWQSDYVLYYLASDDELSSEWLEKYRIVGSFSYKDHLEDLSQAVPWSGGLPCPKFLLLQPVS